MSKGKTPTKVSIENCSVVNQAAPVAPQQAEALRELARAAAANAEAIGRIANALKGAEAHMGTGIRLGRFDDD